MVNVYHIFDELINISVQNISKSILQYQFNPNQLNPNQYTVCYIWP